MPGATEQQRRASKTSLLFAYSASFPSVMNKSGVVAALPRRLRHDLFKGTCIQGAKNYAAWSENVKEFVVIHDTNVPPPCTLACSHARRLALIQKTGLISARISGDSVRHPARSNGVN